MGRSKNIGEFHRSVSEVAMVKGTILKSLGEDFDASPAWVKN